MNSFRYSIWLVPCAEQRAELQFMIDELSGRFGIPPFAPHATLCSGQWEQGVPTLIKTVDGLAKQEVPIRMAVECVDWIEHWFGFFFLRLRCETDLFDRAYRLVNESHPPGMGPHVSLLYRFGDQTIHRESLRDELTVRIPSMITFNSLELVRPSTGRWEDVSGWETLHTVQLNDSGPSSSFRS